MEIYFSLGLNVILIGAVVSLYISNKNNKNIIDSLFKEIDMYKKL